MSDLVREEFERKWGYSNEEQGIYFVPELNIYGSKIVSMAAQAKSTAWFYFQIGWSASREALVIELPADAHLSRDGLDEHYLAGDMCDQIIESIHAAGVKTK